MNRLILIANIVIFALFWFSIPSSLFNPQTMKNWFVMFPNDILHGKNLHTLFTSMFMHGGWLHLFGNMLYLYIFGDNIEDTFGHVGYLAFYLTCGLVAAFSHILVNLYAPVISRATGLIIVSDLTSGVVGASGAIAGVLGAYLVLFPKAKILTLTFYVILPLPAIMFLGFWFLMQWLFVVYDVYGDVAYWAHIGGFVAGAVLALIFGLKRKEKREKRLRL